MQSSRTSLKLKLEFVGHSASLPLRILVALPQSKLSLICSAQKRSLAAGKIINWNETTLRVIYWAFSEDMEACSFKIAVPTLTISGTPDSDENAVLYHKAPVHTLLPCYVLLDLKFMLSEYILIVQAISKKFRHFAFKIFRFLGKSAEGGLWGCGLVQGCKVESIVATCDHVGAFCVTIVSFHLFYLLQSPFHVCA